MDHVLFLMVSVAFSAGMTYGKKQLAALDGVWFPYLGTMRAKNSAFMLEGRKHHRILLRPIMATARLKWLPSCLVLTCSISLAYSPSSSVSCLG